jgi:hypothetical protein
MLLFLCLSFFLQAVLGFFLRIWLLFVGFLAHDVLLHYMYLYSTASPRISNGKASAKALSSARAILNHEQ